MNENKKYDIVAVKKVKINGVEEFYGKIRALRDINNPHMKVEKGECGGWIALYENPVLNTSDESWVGKGSFVDGDSYVSGQAYVLTSKLAGVYVSDNALVIDSEIYSHLGHIEQNGQVIGSQIRIVDSICLDVGGESTIKLSIINGEKFVARGQNELTNCVVTATGRGIDVKGGLKYANVSIEGELTKDSDTIVMAPLKSGWAMSGKEGKSVATANDKK